jgi:hypothetical protein
LRLRYRILIPEPIIISYHPAGTLEVAVSMSSLIVVTGPLHEAKLDRILQQADELYKSLFETADEQQRYNLELAMAHGDRLAVPETTRPAITRLVEAAIVDDLATNRPGSSQRIKAPLVDDNPINLRMLQTFCHKRKIPYITAEDGNMAIERFAQAAEAMEPITLVLMDLQMPHCDGIEATAAIRLLAREEAWPRKVLHFYGHGPRLGEGRDRVEKGWS